VPYTLIEDSLRLKAAIEFGSEYIYTIKNGGLGPTLYVRASSRKDARAARLKLPGEWEGLYIIVIYCSIPDEEESLHDSILT
jgi:hypothetical protein